MDSKDILRATDSTKRLVQDQDYYKYIFKKTEKIISVVFYITHNLEISPREEVYVSDITEAARAVHNAVLESLQTRTHVAEDVIRQTAHTLIALESKLRVSQVAGLLSPEVMHVLASEIDAVLRGMNKYLKSAGAFDDMDYGLLLSDTEEPTAKPRPASRRPALSQSVGMNQTAGSVSSGLGRRERIKTVLEAKGEASIKDISSVITDCSEKTIQRELNAMIEDNVIKRHGERRWSTYSLF